VGIAENQGTGMCSY